ncbi:MAG: hypothetical protein IJU41_00955 [Clostridia bacterium]|nr:hypothetical protein [Clostridia bacterium]
MKKYSTGILLFLWLCLVFAVIAAAEDAVVESGVYTVRHNGSGLYLDCFNHSYTDGGYAYADKGGDKDGQMIEFVRQEDGTYLLYPQSENGSYAFRVAADEVGARIEKRDRIDESSYFDVTLENGAVWIRPHGSALSLGLSQKQTLYRKTLFTLEEATGEGGGFTLSPVGVTSLALKTVSEAVRTNSVGAVYAVVTPACMKKKIEWSCSDESVLLLDDDGSFCALASGVATVTAGVGDFSSEIEVTVTDAPAFTFYSQHMTAGGGWHADELSGVSFYAGAFKRFILPGFNHGLDWMDEGCGITSIATVLHNLGARYNDGCDFRFEADKNLEADPYTVALANTGNIGLSEPGGTLYGNPILFYLSNITKYFTLYRRPIAATETPISSMAAVRDALKLHPEGVIVFLQYGKNSHYTVFTECLNPSETDPSRLRFRIYDPAATERHFGDNVLFEDSMSYKTGYRYTSAVKMITFGLQEDTDP